MKNYQTKQPRGYQSIDGFTRPSQRRPSYNRPDVRSRQPASRPAYSASSQLKGAPPITSRDMRLPAAGSQARALKPHRSRVRTFRKWSLRSASALVVISLIVGGYLFSKGYLQLHKVFGGGVSAAALNSNVNPSLLKGEGSGRVNILLLGIGGPGHDGPDLTDTIMIASIDVVNHKIGLLSVPRDLWVKEPNNFMSEYGKINAAYESGKYHYLGQLNSSNNNKQAVDAGFQAADQTISSVLGIPINYNALINFHAFQQATDAVGGININVPEALVDPTMAWQNNYNSVLAQKGPQHMDGYKALLYSRSRETTSDFARAARQRAVLTALKDKVMTAGTLSDPLKISSLLSALGDNVRTDISFGDMQRMYNIIKGIGSSSIKSVDLDKAPNSFVTTGSLDGQSIVEPTAGLFEYGDIQNFVRNTLPDGYLLKENALVKVLNGTTTPGLATSAVDTLKSYAYRVAAPANAPTSNYQKTILVDLSHTKDKDKYTKHYLERRYGVTAKNKLPAGISQASVGKASFVIILGQDEANSGN